MGLARRWAGFLLTAGAPGSLYITPHSRSAAPAWVARALCDGDPHCRGPDLGMKKGSLPSASPHGQDRRARVEGRRRRDHWFTRSPRAWLR